MKSITTKIWGIMLTLAVLVGLLVPMASATPVSAGDMAWTTITTPNPTNFQVYPSSDVEFLVMGPDGKTMFSYDNKVSPAATVATAFPAPRTVAAAVAVGALTVDITGPSGFLAASTVSIGTQIGVAYTAIAVGGGVGGGDRLTLTVAATVAHNVGEAVVQGQITLTSTAGFPATGTASIGTELVTYTGITAPALTGLVAAGTGAITRAHGVGDTASSGKLVKSTDGAATWTDVSVGGGLNGLIVNAMSISTDYASDTTIVAAVTGVDSAAAFDMVYRSIDGGQTFGAMPPIAAIAPATMTISSVAVSPWYKGGQAILAGYASNTGAGTGGASLFTTLDLTWLNLATVAGWNAGVTGGDVSGVAFSPKHKVDAQLMVLSSTAAGGTWLKTRFGTNAWDADVDVASASAEFKNDNGARIPSAAAGGMVGAFAFPDDYDWAGNNRIIVGIGNTGTINVDDVYRYQGSLAGGQTRVSDLNATGTGSSVTNVNTVAFKGNIADGTCVVGQRDNKTIVKSTNISGSPVSWVTSTKNPTGDVAVGAPRTIVLTSPTSTDIFAGTQGVGSALSRSTDGAVSFDGVSLIDVSGTAAATNLALTSNLGIVNDKLWFMTMKDDVDASASNTAGDYYMVMKTEDAGATWKMVLAIRQTGALDSLSNFASTRTFATDNTIYAWQADTRFWKSSDGGATWIGYTAQANITAFGIIDKDTYFTGAANAIYKAGRFTSATLDGETPMFIIMLDANTLAVGTMGGDVLISTDDGVTFTRLGPNDSLGAGARVTFTPDPKYATNKIIYAASSNPAGGLYRWTMGQSSTWEQVTGLPFAVSGVNVAADGTLYTGRAAAGFGILRQVNPTFPLSKINSVVAAAVESPFEYVNNNGMISGFDAVSTLVTHKRTTVAGVNRLFEVAGSLAPGSYGYPFRLWVLDDNMMNPPAITAPKAGTVANRNITFQWAPVTTPLQPTYKWQLATDAEFAGLVPNPAGGVYDMNTPGTTIQVLNLVPGNSYFWRVRIDTAKPLASRYTPPTQFTVKLGETQFALNLLVPDPKNATGQPIKPIFQWSSVAGADSYEMELADNPFFANAQAKKPLMNTVWAWDKDLTYNTTYYWRVRAVSGKNVSDWVQGVFTTMPEPTVAPTATTQPTSTIVIPPASTPPKYFDPQSGLYFNSDAELKAYQAAHPVAPPPSTPGYIWAIIIIAAILVIAVIVLIVRTRRVA